jgi:hypothetical protein
MRVIQLTSKTAMKPDRNRWHRLGIMCFPPLTWRWRAPASGVPLTRTGKSLEWGDRHLRSATGQMPADLRRCRPRLLPRGSGVGTVAGRHIPMLDHHPLARVYVGASPPLPWRAALVPRDGNIRERSSEGCSPRGGHDEPHRGGSSIRTVV